jgi:hypothetical protein
VKMLLSCIASGLIINTSLADGKKTIDSISGAGFSLIQRAVPELRAKWPQAKLARVEVYEGPDGFYVIFDSRERDINQRGAVGSPSFEVQLSKSDFHIISSHFTK